MRRTLVATIATLALGAATIGAAPAQAMSPYSQASHGWVCTIAAGVVAAGVGALTAGITGGLAGTGFMAGCELASSGNRRPYILVGVPNPRRNCWYVFRRPGNKRSRVEECAV